MTERIRLNDLGNKNGYAFAHYILMDFLVLRGGARWLGYLCCADF